MAKTAHDGEVPARREEARATRPAVLMSGMIVLMSFSRENLEAVDGLSIRATRYLQITDTGSVKSGDRELHVAVARVLVNSSGPGNFRSDIEADIRRHLHIAQGAENEVTVGLLPSSRPAPLSEEQAAQIRMTESKAIRDAIFEKA